MKSRVTIGPETSVDLMNGHEVNIRIPEGTTLLSVRLSSAGTRSPAADRVPSSPLIEFVDVFFNRRKAR